jgi:hypothetical protein
MDGALEILGDSARGLETRCEFSSDIPPPGEWSEANCKTYPSQKHQRRTGSPIRAGAPRPKPPPPPIAVETVADISSNAAVSSDPPCLSTEMLADLSAVSHSSSGSDKSDTPEASSCVSISPVPPPPPPRLSSILQSVQDSNASQGLQSSDSLEYRASQAAPPSHTSASSSCEPLSVKSTAGCDCQRSRSKSNPVDPGRLRSLSKSKEGPIKRPRAGSRPKLGIYSM